MGTERRRTRIDSKIMRLPVDVRELVDARLRDNSITFQEISDWLKERGFEISKSAVGRYALSMNEAAQRVAETLEKMRAIVKAVEDNPDVDYTKASRIMAMDGLLQKVTTAEDEFLDLPLDKAVRLIASLSRTEIYDQKSKQEQKSKMELAFDGMEAELSEKIKADPQLRGEFHDVMEKARRRLFGDGG